MDKTVIFRSLVCANAINENYAVIGVELSDGHGKKIINDLNNDFEDYVNSDSIIFQRPETDYWKNYLKSLINEHFKETNSKIAEKILLNFNSEVKKFQQVCPKEMLDKLSNPLTLKPKILTAV